MELNTREQIACFLRIAHEGEENAIHVKAMAAYFGMDPQTLRRCVCRLRRDGWPICSCRRGLYWASNFGDYGDLYYRCAALRSARPQSKSKPRSRPRPRNHRTTLI